MNPGYLSYILLLVSLIFIGFGWRTHAIGDGSAKSAVLFSLAWIACAAWTWRAFGVSGTFVYAPLAALAASAFVKLSRSETATALSYGCLAGAVCSLVELLETADPLMIAVHPAVDPVLAAAALAVAYSRRPAAQLAVLAVALVANDVYLELLYADRSPASFGDRGFQDAWWLAASLARASSVAGAAAIRRARRGGSRLRGWLRVRR